MNPSIHCWLIYLQQYSNKQWFKLELPPATQRRYPNPVYYHSKTDNKEYIILSPHSKDYRDCFRYDISLNTWNKFTSYPENIEAQCHALAINQTKELLYLSHGHTQMFMVYDLISNK